MELEKIVSYAALLAVLAAYTGQLPHIIQAIQIAELKLLKDSQASHWGQAYLLK